MYTLTKSIKTKKKQSKILQTYYYEAYLTMDLQIIS